MKGTFFACHRSCYYVRRDAESRKTLQILIIVIITIIINNNIIIIIIIIVIIIIIIIIMIILATCQMLGNVASL